MNRPPTVRPPMKRHSGLVPLSRDHHHGLVMARRLILGKPMSPHDDWPSDPAEQAARLREFFETDLRPHFEAEEACVFPVAAGALPDGDALVGALLADHRAMEAMIGGLSADPISRSPAADPERRLAAFGELLEAHIHTEERVLFERMQAHCDPAELEALGRRMAERRADRPAASGPNCRR